MPLRLIADVEAPSKQGVIADYALAGTRSLPDLVLRDLEVPFTVEPVVRNPVDEDSLWSPDHDATDTFEVRIGLPGEAALVVATPSTQLAAADVTLPTAYDYVHEIAFTPGTYGGTFLVDVQAQGSTVTVGVARPTFTAEEMAIFLARHPLVHYKETDEDDNVAVTKSGTSFFVHWTGNLGAHGAAILTSSVANPTVITTATEHGLRTGENAEIAGHSGSTPSINSTYVVTVISDTTFSVPVNVTVAGTGGTVTGGDAPSFTVENIDLMSPQGVSGVIDLDETALVTYSAAQPGESFQLYATVRRTKTSGEVHTILGPAPFTMWKDIQELEV